MATYHVVSDTEVYGRWFREHGVMGDFSPVTEIKEINPTEADALEAELMELDTVECWDMGGVSTWRGHGWILTKELSKDLYTLFPGKQVPDNHWDFTDPADEYPYPDTYLDLRNLNNTLQELIGQYPGLDLEYAGYHGDCRAQVVLLLVNEPTLLDDITQGFKSLGLNLPSAHEYIGEASGNVG